MRYSPAQHVRPLARTACIALALSALLAGCAPAEEPSPAPAPTPNAQQPAEEPQARPLELPAAVYLLANGTVTPVRRSLDIAAPAAGEPRSDDPAVLQALLEMLVEGPSAEELAAGYASALGPDIEVVGVRVEGGVATAGFSAGFASGGAAAVAQRCAQVVFTLTGAGVERVAFEVDGVPFDAPGRTREDFPALRPSILVTSPLPGDAISSPVPLRGESNTSGASFVIQVVDASGQTVTEQLFTGGGSGQWLGFETSVEFEASPGAGQLLMYDPAAPGGMAGPAARVPVTFE